MINCDEAVLTGNKMEQKYHRTHSGWIGGLKETKYTTLMAEAELGYELGCSRYDSFQHPGR